MAAPRGACQNGRPMRDSLRGRPALVRLFAVCVALFAAAPHRAGQSGVAAKRTSSDAGAARGVQIAVQGTYPELWVDGKPFFVNSAAFLYPRIPRNLWEVSLDRYREIGVNTIELSIPWNWHEIREREYDFDGHTNPRRDLRALLQLVARHDFKLIARPGPAIPREWRNSGFPDWLLQQPDLRIPLADRLEGRVPPVATPAAQSWLEALARELAPYDSATAMRVPANGPSGSAVTLREPQDVPGPLVLVQVESGQPISGNMPAAQWNDVQSLCKAIAGQGVTAPCAIALQQFASAAAGSSSGVAAVGRWFLPPEDTELTDEGRRLGPADVARLEFSAAALSTQPDFPSVLVEYDAGWFAPVDDTRPQPSPAENTRLSRYLSMAYGVRGLNWFPFQDALTPAGYTTPFAGRHYRWDAPLALNASRQARATEALRMGEWLRQWGDRLAASHRRADFGLVDLLPALRPEEIGDLRRTDLTEAVSTLIKLQRLAQYAGLSSEMIDPEHQPVEQLLRNALLLLPTLRSREGPALQLTDQAQRALDRYVRSGGVLVCFPERPRGALFDMIYRDAAAQPAHLPAGSLEWKAGAGRLIVLTKDFYSWVEPADNFADGAKRFEASFGLSMLDAFFQEAGIRPSVRHDSSRPLASLVATEVICNQGTLPLGDRSGGQGWLAVVNLGDEPVTDEKFQVLSPRAPARARNIGPDEWLSVSVSLPPRDALFLPLDLSLCLDPAANRPCSDSVIASGAELVRAERDGKSMLLTFKVPAKTQVRVRLADKPGHYEVDESHADAHWDGARKELDVDLLRGASPDFRRVVRIPLSYQPSLPVKPKPDADRHIPARFRFYPAGAVRLPLGTDANLLTTPPLFAFRRDADASIWVIAENRGGEPADAQVRADGQFNTSAHGYVGGGEMRSLNLKLPSSTVQKSATQPPSADGLYHGTLHFGVGADAEDLPASYLIVPAQGAIGYTFDFDADGNAERVLETDSLRAIFSPADGGRLIALVDKKSDANVAAPMGLLADVFSFTPSPAEAPLAESRGRTGTFNRAYSAEWVAGDGGPALRLSAEMPDAYPHGARIEKMVRLTDENHLTAEYHVALSAADAQRLDEEAAGRIFAAPLPQVSAAQSFQVLSLVPADRDGNKGTEFCWAGEQGTGGSAARCQPYIPGGPAMAVPGGITRVEIRQPRRPTLALDWSAAPAGTRLTLEPKRFSVLLRLAFPPLAVGGAAAAYRIEFSVVASP